MVADDDADAAAAAPRPTRRPVDRRTVPRWRARAGARPRPHRRAPLAQVRAAAAAVGVTLPDEAVIKMRPLAQAARPADLGSQPQRRAPGLAHLRRRRPREFVQALRWHAMQACGAGAQGDPQRREDLELFHARRHELIHRCTTPTRRVRRRDRAGRRAGQPLGADERRPRRLAAAAGVPRPGTARAGRRRHLPGARRRRSAGTRARATSNARRARARPGLRRDAGPRQRVVAAARLG